MVAAWRTRVGREWAPPEQPPTSIAEARNQQDTALPAPPPVPEAGGFTKGQGKLAWTHKLCRELKVDLLPVTKEAMERGERGAGSRFSPFGWRALADARTRGTVDALEGQGIRYMYPHQYTQMRAILAGESVTITDPAFSGKTVTMKVGALWQAMRRPEGYCIVMLSTMESVEDTVNWLRTVSSGLLREHEIVVAQRGEPLDLSRNPRIIVGTSIPINEVVRRVGFDCITVFAADNGLATASQSVSIVEGSRRAGAQIISCLSGRPSDTLVHMYLQWHCPLRALRLFLDVPGKILIYGGVSHKKTVAWLDRNGYGEEYVEVTAEMRHGERYRVCGSFANTSKHRILIASDAAPRMQFPCTRVLCMEPARDAGEYLNRCCRITDGMIITLLHEEEKDDDDDDGGGGGGGPELITQDRSIAPTTRSGDGDSEGAPSETTSAGASRSRKSSQYGGDDDDDEHTPATCDVYKMAKRAFAAGAYGFQGVKVEIKGANADVIVVLKRTTEALGNNGAKVRQLEARMQRVFDYPEDGSQGQLRVLLERHKEGDDVLKLKVSEDGACPCSRALDDLDSDKDASDASEEEAEATEEDDAQRIAHDLGIVLRPVERNALQPLHASALDVGAQKFTTTFTPCPTAASWDNMMLQTRTRSGMARAGLTAPPTPLQQRLVPKLCKGTANVVVQGAPGTGKTAAICIALRDLVHRFDIDRCCQVVYFTADDAQAQAVYSMLAQVCEEDARRLRIYLNGNEKLWRKPDPVAPKGGKADGGDKGGKKGAKGDKGGKKGAKGDKGGKKGAKGAKGGKGKKGGKNTKGGKGGWESVAQKSNIARANPSLPIQPTIAVGTPAAMLAAVRHGHLKLDMADVVVYDDADALYVYPDGAGSKEGAPAEKWHTWEAGMSCEVHPPEAEGRQHIAEFMKSRTVAHMTPDARHIFVSTLLPDALLATIKSVAGDAEMVRITDGAAAGSLPALIPPLQQHYIHKACVKEIALTKVLAALKGPTVVFCRDEDSVEVVQAAFGRISAAHFVGRRDEDGPEDDYNIMKRVSDSTRAQNRDATTKVPKGIVVTANGMLARGSALDHVPKFPPVAVVNFDVPDDPETYVLRAGRCGRLGRPGIVVTIVEEQRQGRRQHLTPKQEADAAAQAALLRKQEWAWVKPFFAPYAVPPAPPCAKNELTHIERQRAHDALKAVAATGAETVFESSALRTLMVRLTDRVKLQQFVEKPTPEAAVGMLRTTIAQAAGASLTLEDTMTIWRLKSCKLFAASADNDMLLDAFMNGAASAISPVLSKEQMGDVYMKFWVGATFGEVHTRLARLNKRTQQRARAAWVSLRRAQKAHIMQLWATWQEACDAQWEVARTGLDGLRPKRLKRKAKAKKSEKATS